jgi:hypothetical protein
MKKVGCLLLVLVLSPLTLAADSLPMVTIDGDKFLAGGKEFKIWGFNLGHGLHLTDRQLDRQVEQLAFLGTNMMRIHTIDWTPWWDSPGPNGEHLASGLIADPDPTTRHYINQDKFYRLLNKFREKGIYVAITVSVGRFFKPGDVDILRTDDADAKAWSEAVAAVSENIGMSKILPVFDERALALRKEFATFLLSMKNPQTGVKLAEDPQLALLNTVNEMSSGTAFYHDVNRYPNIPPYFLNKVIKRWCEFLRTQYATDEKLAAAWQEKGKRGLLPDESLAKGKINLLPVDVATVPLKKGEIPFSEQRRKDFIAFLFDMDAKHQREMVAHYRSLGWTRPCIYSDTVSVDGETGPMWVKSGLMPYVEDHPYDEPNVNLFNWGWLRLVQNYGANFFGPEGPDRPYWGSEINQSCNVPVNELRISFPLYIAAYHSLQGRDGLTWFVWGIKRKEILLTSEATNAPEWCSMRVDYPQLYVFRAAGRLFKSCEIAPLARSDVRRTQMLKDASIDTGQVYRINGENGCLRVKTEHFRALAVPKDYKYDFGDVVLDLTAKTYNVVIVEKLNDKTYEVTAVGKTGGMRFEPLEFVAGTVTFKNRQIEKIDHIEYPGDLIETVPGQGSQMPFVHGVRLYRVTLK